MKKSILTDKEKLTLYGLTKFPNTTDKNLSQRLGVKHSTITSIRHRLRQNGYYRTLKVPMLQKIGCQMLVIIYTNFSLLIPVEERVKITGKTIEVFDEIFYSVGEADKGFSLSLSKDYATIGKINDIRTQTFGTRGLLENQYPNLVVFPFDISRIYRFFDYSLLLKKTFNLDLPDNEGSDLFDPGMWETDNITLSNTEKKVFNVLIENPESSDSEVGELIGISRHTVSKLRRDFESRRLINTINIPNLKKLGFDILAFFHIKFDPRNPPLIDSDEPMALLGDSIIFFSSRRFETIMLGAYYDYDSYKADRTRVIQVLKENNWVADHPLIRTYSLNKMVVIKDFKFVPITQKIIEFER